MTKRRNLTAKQMGKRLAKMPQWMQDFCTTKAYDAKPKRWKGQAKWGAASEVRHIDPATGEVIAAQNKTAPQPCEAAALLTERLSEHPGFDKEKHTKTGGFVNELMPSDVLLGER